MTTDRTGEGGPAVETALATGGLGGQEGLARLVQGGAGAGERVDGMEFLRCIRR